MLLLEKATICFFLSIGSTIGYLISLYNNWGIPAVAFAIAFSACIVWHCSIISGAKKADYKAKKSRREEINKLYKRLEAIESSLDLKAKADTQKQAPKKVRPGSKPSTRYLEMDYLRRNKAE